jgi:hypothetical protein
MSEFVQSKVAGVIASAGHHLRRMIRAALLVVPLTLPMLLAACEDEKKPEAGEAAPSEESDTIDLDALIKRVEEAQRKDPRWFDEEKLFSRDVPKSAVRRCLDKLPTGEPDNPFCISVIEGDGWRMYDAGPGLHGWDNNAVWIDDRKLVFVSSHYHRPETTRIEQLPGYSRIFLWDVDEGIRPYSGYRIGSSPVGICYSGKWFRVVLNRETKTTPKKVLKGPLDNLQVHDEFHENTGALSPHIKSMNKYECRWQDAPEFNDPYRIYWSLRDGDGYLIAAPREKPWLDTPRPAWLKNKTTGLEVELPFTATRGRLTCLRYVDFKDAYFGIPCLLGGWKKDPELVEAIRDRGCVPAFWLYRDGRVETVCLPSARILESLFWEPIPTRNGLIIYYTSGHYPGLYLYRDGKEEAILLGYINGGKPPPSSEMDLSPDGCRVSFLTAPDHTSGRFTGPQRTWRILDVCPEGQGR